MIERKRIEPTKDLSAVIKEYYDSLEAIRAELVPVKEGRTVAFVDEEKLRDKVSDIYSGLCFYEGKPTSSQVEGLNKLQQDMNNNEKKLQDREKTYRPKVKAEMKRVTWPSWKQVRATTGVVIAAVFLFAAYFWVVDIFCSRMVNVVIHKFSR